jgi:hypothetical protein
LVLEVELVLVLLDQEVELLASRSHFNLTVLHDTATELFECLVQIFRRDHNAVAAGERLDLEAPVLELRHHLLDGTDLVYDV